MKIKIQATEYTEITESDAGFSVISVCSVANCFFQD
jgi:hypothetical protein